MGSLHGPKKVFKITDVLVIYRSFGQLLSLPGPKVCNMTAFLAIYGGFGPIFCMLLGLQVSSLASVVLERAHVGGHRVSTGVLGFSIKFVRG